MHRRLTTRIYDYDVVAV